MKLVVGLGNPGLQYEHTRHNVGFRVVDKFAAKMGWKWTERRARAILASGTVGTEKVILAKPITFMNLSGEAVGELVRWYKLQPEDVLVVCDDLDLPVGMSWVCLAATNASSLKQAKTGPSRLLS